MSRARALQLAGALLAVSAVGVAGGLAGQGDAAAAPATIDSASSGDRESVPVPIPPLRPRESGAVPMPQVRPREPGPVPIPEARLRGPRPVPMPLVADPDVTGPIPTPPRPPLPAGPRRLPVVEPSPDLVVPPARR